MPTNDPDVGVASCTHLLTFATTLTIVTETAAKVWLKRYWLLIVRTCHIHV